MVNKNNRNTDDSNEEKKKQPNIERKDNKNRKN